MRPGAMNQVRKIVQADTDAALAGRLGVSKETLRLIERGKRNPSSAFMAGVCVATRQPFTSWFMVSV